MKYTLLLLLGLLSFSFVATAQDEIKPRKSPMSVANYKTGDSYIKVVYSQPSKRDRTIFGGIVPFDKIWRTGANEATEITFTTDVKIGDKKIKAGTYSLFTIPGKKKWTIILNSDLGMWGHYDYNEASDVHRFVVKPETIEAVWQSFTIDFSKGAESKAMRLVWDNTKVSIPFELSE